MNFVFIFGGKFAGNLVGILRDSCSDPQNKGSNILSTTFRSIFREKNRASKTIFRANFVLHGN